MDLLSRLSFELPTRIEFGTGVTARVADTLKELDTHCVLIVTDKGIRSAGLLDKVTAPLVTTGITFEIFDNVEPNPKDYKIEEGTEAAKRIEADCIVAVGGGSPIDCAKAVAVLTSLGGKLPDYAGIDKIGGTPLPVVAIPATAGSASEVTFSAVLTDSRAKSKFSLRSARIAPVVALADPVMTSSMPPDLTAATGMDALTHAVEAYTSLPANAFSDACALQAVELVSKHLARAVSNGQDMEARAGMLLGSMLAGIAFSHSDVGAVHCLAESLGGMYDAPHGLCNSVMLPAVMEYNLDYSRERYARVASAMGLKFDTVEEGARMAVEAVRRLSAEIGLPGFASLGISESDFTRIAHLSASNGSNPSNPRPMTEDDYLHLLQQMSDG